MVIDGLQSFHPISYWPNICSLSRKDKTDSADIVLID